jgi:hypothetical protein
MQIARERNKKKEEGSWKFSRFNRFVIVSSTTKPLQKEQIHGLTHKLRAAYANVLFLFYKIGSIYSLKPNALQISVRKTCSIFFRQCLHLWKRKVGNKSLFCDNWTSQNAIL